LLQDIHADIPSEGGKKSDRKDKLRERFCAHA
jgi:hypothetical protein